MEENKEKFEDCGERLTDPVPGCESEYVDVVAAYAKPLCVDKTEEFKSMEDVGYVYDPSYTGGEIGDYVKKLEKARLAIEVLKTVPGQSLGDPLATFSNPKGIQLLDKSMDAIINFLES